MPVTFKAATKWKYKDVGIHSSTTIGGGFVKAKDTVSVPLGLTASAKVQWEYDVNKLFTAPGEAFRGIGLTIDYKL